MSAPARSFLSASLVLALSLAAPVLDAPRVEAQRVEVRPPRRGGEAGGRVEVSPRRGAVVVTPDQPRRGGAVVVTPEPRRGGAVVVAPPRGGVVVAPPRGGVVVAPPRGVVVARRPPPVRVMAPPPARRATIWRPPTAPGEVWIEGYWHWSGADWQWVDGHWELPPQPGAIWVGPQVDGAGWVPGYWTMSSTMSPGPGYPAGGMVRPYQLGAYVSGLLGAQDPRDAGGGFYHDYALALSAGQTVTLLAVGGPSDQYPGQRLAVSLQLVSNGMVIASDQPMPGSPDARLAFTANQSGVYVVRVRSRGGPYSTGTYVLESANGTWMPEVNPYDQLWGGGSVHVQPQPQPQPQWGGGAQGGAMVVAVGSQVSAMLEPTDPIDETGGQYDDIVVQARPGETFTVVARGGVTLSGRSTLDVTLRAFADGYEVAQDDDSAGSRNARVIVSAPRSGQIVLRVGSWRGSMERTGQYTVVVLPGAQPYAQ